MENRFEELAKRARTISLSKEEKDAGRKNLLHFMSQHPLESKPLSQEKKTGFFASFFVMPRVGNGLAFESLVLASLVIVLFFGSGIAFAAQYSLPGDLLYPVKTGFNEKVAVLTLFSQQAKAEYDINLAQLRLQEFETISARNTLDQETTQEIKTLLNNHIANIQARITNLQAKEDDRLAIEINSKLEATLNAHASIIGNLSSKQDAKSSFGVSVILPDIKGLAKEILQKREDGQSKLLATSSAVLEAAAESKRNEVLHQLQEVSVDLEIKKADISSSTHAKAKLDIALAFDMIAKGNVYLDKKEYNSAFIMFQDALRKVQEITIYITTEASLKLQVSMLDFGDHTQVNSQTGALIDIIK